MYQKFDLFFLVVEEITIFESGVKQNRLKGAIRNFLLAHFDCDIASRIPDLTESAMRPLLANKKEALFFQGPENQT